MTAAKTRIGRPPIYEVRSDWFELPTPDSTYTVGLFQADGSNQRDRGIVCITLKRSDLDLLVTLSASFAGGRPIRYDGHGNPKLMVQNRALSDGLARRGVVSPKTRTASTHPDLLGDRDYWRGVVDGDGTLCQTRDGRRILALVGTEAICDQFLAFCHTHGAGLRCTVTPHKSIFTARVSGRDAVAMADVLYTDATLALPRKHAIARSWKDAS